MTHEDTTPGAAKLYIYHELFDLTCSWHNGGGLVILTDRDPQVAWEASDARKESSRQEPLPEADKIVSVQGPVDEYIRVFPDAGCC